MENRIEILVGLRAAKSAFQETLEFCKTEADDYRMVDKYALGNDTVSGICYFLLVNAFYDAQEFVDNFFKHKFLTKPIFLANTSVENCIKYTAKRVEWLESKIKELEVIS